MNTSQPEVNLPTITGDSTTATVLSTPLNAFNVKPNLNQASKGDSITVTSLSTPLNAFNVIPNLNQEAILQTHKALIATQPPLNHAILTPPPTVETPSSMTASPKRKRSRIQFLNYLDDDESTKKRRSRRLRSKSDP